MKRRKRRNFSNAFKTKVVIEALKERYSLQELAEKFELHPNQISTWKKEFLSNADQVFSKGKSKESEDSIPSEELYQKIGRLEMERDFLKKSLEKLDCLK